MNKTFSCPSAGDQFRYSCYRNVYNYPDDSNVKNQNSSILLPGFLKSPESFLCHIMVLNWRFFSFNVLGT